MSNKLTNFFTCKARYLIFSITGLCLIYFLLGSLDLPFKQSSDVQAQCTSFCYCLQAYRAENGEVGPEQCANLGNYTAFTNQTSGGSADNSGLFFRVKLYPC